jgi:acetyltransferase
VGRRIAVVGSGGGHSILATDAVELNGFEARAFAPHIVRRIQAKLPPWAPAGNPVDMTGAFLDDLALFADLTRIALEDPQGFGGSLNYGVYGYQDVNLKDRAGRTYESAAPLLGQLQREAGRPIIFFAPYARDGLACFRSMREAGVPCYDSLDVAARCLRALRQRAEIVDRLARDEESPGPPPARAGDEHLAAARGRPGRNLTEPEALAFLAEHGIPVPPRRLARRRDEAVAAAEALGYPVVLKVVSADIVHKSEVGGVALDLRSSADVAAAFDLVTGRARERAPGATVQGVLLASFRPGGTEIIAGIVRDPQFGLVLMAGLGGVFAEVMADTALRVLPAGPGEIGAMLRELRGFPVLAGARGGAAAHLGALEALLDGLGRLAVAHPEIAQLDLNPILAGPAGAVVADARIMLGLEEG